MEKRVVLAVILSILVLMGYQYFFVRPKRPIVPAGIPGAAAPPAAAPVTTGEVREEPKPAVVGTKPGPVEAMPKTAPQDLTVVAGRERQDIVIDTPLYTAVWTNEGGVLKSWKLKLYKDSLKKKKADRQALELVRGAVAPDRDPAETAPAPGTGPQPFSLDLDDRTLADALNGKLYEVSRGSEPITGASSMIRLEDGEKATLGFKYKEGASITAVKTFTFTGGRYDMQIDLRVSKDNNPVAASLLWGPGIGNPTEADLKQSRNVNRGLAAYTGGDRPRVVRVNEKNLKSGQAEFNYVRWAAYEDHYFVALFLLAQQSGRVVFRQEPAVPGQAAAHALSMSQPQRAFIGPKESEALIGFGADAKNVIQYGSFLGLNLKAVAEIMLKAVKFSHRLIPNWGVAIILLTLFIKLIFFPLTYSSTKSMAKMADLQPKLKAIRTKYKKAKSDIAQRRQMNEEMMKLYKEHGVNPAGGCLPMLIQLPVFIGVYQMLIAAVEFRHSPFVFWIKDLSVHDPTFVTPILMGVTQYISQKMTPTSADPSQAKIMLIMPVMMTALFLTFQSGLVLYWLTSNVLQIGQQAIMNRMMARPKRDANGKRK